jgi:hypothetical protein
MVVEQKWQKIAFFFLNGAFLVIIFIYGVDFSFSVSLFNKI